MIVYQVQSRIVPEPFAPLYSNTVYAQYNQAYSAIRDIAQEDAYQRADDVYWRIDNGARIEMRIKDFLVIGTK